MGRKAQALSMAADTAAMHMRPFRPPILIVAVALVTAVSGGALLHAASSSDVPSGLALVDDSSGTSTSPLVVETTSSTSSTSSTTQATSTTIAPAPSATGDLWIGDVGQGAWEEIQRCRRPRGSRLEQLPSTHTPWGRRGIRDETTIASTNATMATWNVKL